MADRRPVQQAHERTFVNHFLNWFNSAYRTDFKVTSEPNPPDAVISSSRAIRWVEVSTAFWTTAYARDLYSYATPDEEHVPVGAGPFQGMDNEFARNFVAVVKKKLEKDSYIEWRDKYGPGYLVVPIKHLWFDARTVKQMKIEWTASKFDDLGCFRGIYIAFQSNGAIKLSRWSAK